jgi:hypothetical protein
LQRRWNGYLARKPYRVFTQFNEETRRHECKLRVKSSFPEGLDKLAHNAANAIRHSFDQSMWAVTRIVAPGWDQDIYFPWGTSPKDVQGKLKRTPLPKEIQSIILSFEPYNTGDGYAGGDNILRDFAKAVNPSKHRLSVTVEPNFVPSGIALINPPIGEYIDTTIRIYPSRRVATKGEHPIAAILSANRKLEYKFDVSCAIIFGDGSPLSGQPVIETLSRALAASENFIIRLHARTIAHN